MSDFPALKPQSRTFTPGNYAAVQVRTLEGSETSVRRSNASVGHTLSLVFISGDPAQQNEIFKHYGINNRFLPFDLSAEALEGSGLTFPTGYQWIYRNPPSVEYSPDSVTVSLSLELVPPYAI
jgi:hypothetical protein